MVSGCWVYKVRGHQQYKCGLGKGSRAIIMVWEVAPETNTWCLVFSGINTSISYVELVALKSRVKKLLSCGDCSGKGGGCNCT